MPYNPSQTYQGGNLIFQGATAGSEAISKGFEQYQKAQKEHEGDQLVVDYALKNNLITPEQHTQYLNGSRSQKNDVVAGLTRTFAMDMQRKEQDRLAQTADLQRQKAPYELRSSIAESNYNVARAQKERSEIPAPGATGDPSLKKLMNPYTGEPTDWAMAVDPVSKQRFPLFVGKTGGLTRDPITGGLGTMDPKTGKFAPLTAQEIQGIMLDPTNPQRKKPEPTKEGGTGMVDQIYNWIKGSKTTPAAPAPQPQPQPQSLPAATLTPGGTASGKVDAIAVLREAKAAIAKNPRARTAILERVRGMGIDASGL